MIPRRKPLNQLQISEWSLILLKTISLELSKARTSGAKKKIADTPSNAMEKFKLYNRVFFYCFVCDLMFVKMLLLLSDPTYPHHGKSKI